jgi:hypothetical protein
MTNTTIEIKDLPPLTLEERDDASFRARDLGWSVLVDLFERYSQTESLSYQRLGDRIKRSRSHVQRWLSSPFNLSLGSLGLLAEGLNADLVIRLEPRSARSARSNYCHPSDAASGTVVSRGVSLPSTTSTRVESAPVGTTAVTSAPDREIALVDA